MGMVIGETVTDGETGVSVTLDGCLYDGRRLALALTVEGGAAAENLDGRTYTYTVANNTGQYLLSLTRRETIEAIAAEAGGDILQDEEEQARWMYSEPVNTIYLRTDEARPEVLHLEIVTDLQIIQADDEVLLHLEDLTHQDEVIAPGAWEFTFTLPPRTMGRYDQGETAVDTPEGAVTVYAAAVEPSYVSIDCDGPYRENAWSLTIERVRLTDGTIVPIHDSQVRAMTGEEDVMRVTEIQGSYQELAVRIAGGCGGPLPWRGQLDRAFRTGSGRSPDGRGMKGKKNRREAALPLPAGSFIGAHSPFDGIQRTEACILHAALAVVAEQEIDHPPGRGILRLVGAHHGVVIACEGVVPSAMVSSEG